MLAKSKTSSYVVSGTPAITPKFAVHVNPRFVGRRNEAAVVVRDHDAEKSYRVKEVQFTGPAILVHRPTEPLKATGTAAYMLTSDPILVTTETGETILVNDSVEAAAAAYKGFAENEDLYGC